MKNAYEVRGDVTVIFVMGRHGAMQQTVIDTEDLVVAESFPNSWRAHYECRYDRYYVQGSVKEAGRKRVYVLARMIVDAQKGDEVDHINHDSLDNRKQNLRPVSSAQNQQNRMGAQINNKSSGIRGVSRHKQSGKWEAHVKLNQKSLRIGYYDLQSDAAIAAALARSALMPFSAEARLTQWVKERYGDVLSIPSSEAGLVQLN